jgi:hypothetical protein
VPPKPATQISPKAAGVHPVTVSEWFRGQRPRDDTLEKVADFLPARLIRYGHSLCIRINQSLNYHLRTLYGMHELAHVWRHEIGMACIYADEDTVTKDPGEDFADLFAWFVTSEARVFQEPIAWRRPPANRWALKLQQLERAGYDDSALAIATSQTECRIRDWKRGRGKPDPATARILERMLSGVIRSSIRS